MLDPYLGARLEALRRTQNPDGGWGYFAGKQSWLEPTAYAALALQGERAADRAWALLKTWQGSDGAWRPSATVQVENWGTSLCVTIAAARGEWNGPAQQGVNWLLGSSGAESSLFNRAAARVGLMKPDRDLSLQAWPWKPGTSSWVEPTAHALVALKKVPVEFVGGHLRDRVRMGEQQLMSVRCSDGGWNYGSSAALGQALGSYPETTALALLGLQGRTDLAASFEAGRKMARETPSPLARAWLTLALRLHGQPADHYESGVTPDLVLTAVEALASPEGNHGLMKTGRAA